MDANNPVSVLVDYVSLQQALWGKLRNACGGATAPLLFDVPKSGFVDHDGRRWSIKKHGQGVLFSEEGGGRRIDLHDIAAGADRLDSWRLATYFGGLGREGEKFISRVIGTPGGTMEQRVEQWLTQLAADGVLVQDGPTYRLADGPPG
jgi:hypothetical protein